MDIDFLHELRFAECEIVWKRYLQRLAKDQKVLEIGGGTGFQAKCLADFGVDITSIDVSESNYRDHQVFPVLSYDGYSIPFPDQHFDVLFSSNVLEHVADLPQMHREIRRVLKPDGFCVHVLPSASWRCWSIISGIATWVTGTVGQATKTIFRPIEFLRTIKRSGGRFVDIFRRHGERGLGLTELYLFSHWWWQRNFAENGFQVAERTTTELFYTGYSCLGRRVPIWRRRQIAKCLGSSCNMFLIKPRYSGTKIADFN